MIVHFSLYWPGKNMMVVLQIVASLDLPFLTRGRLQLRWPKWNGWMISGGFDDIGHLKPFS